MGNIFEDLVEDMPVKPGKSKLVLKWVVRGAILLIGVAFIAGQVKIKSLNKVSNFEKALEENTKVTIELKQEMTDGFNAVNKRIDKVYDDGYKAFDDYTIFNKEQLKMIIDYSQSNKDMLKRMLDISTMEKSKNVENQIEKAKVSLPPVSTPSKFVDSSRIVVKKLK